MRALVFLLACAAATGQSAKVVPLGKSIAEYSSTPAIRPESALTTNAVQPKLTVFTGDDIVSQFVNGGGWKTTIVFANLETYTVFFDVFFISDAGSDLTVPIQDVGAVHAIDVSPVFRPNRSTI